ncbi:MAG: heme-binding domain-containing protein [Bacteroidota bacterium]
MKKIIKPLLLVLLAAFIIIQFFKPEKNIHPGTDAVKNNITSLYPAPEDVEHILQTSCYDCHSNNTKYPWYNNIQPVTWWLNHHVNDAKKDLNFDEFATYKLSRQYKKAEQIIDEVKEGKMPLSSYTFIHTEAKLNADQKTAIQNWAAAIMDTLEARYPADSLIKK